MRIAICDDNAADAQQLSQYLADYLARHCYQGELVTFSSGEAFLAAFEPGVFDLVFLDIYLPGISGVDIAQTIRKTDWDCLIMFLTNSDSHTMDGFLVNASGYVVKPLARERMDRAMHLCRERFARSARTIEIPYGRGTLPVRQNQIRYVEVYKRSTLFHLHGSTVESRITLRDAGTLLGGLPFLQCHRCYIVNMNCIVDLRTEDLLMRGGDTVPIRKNGRREVRLAVAKFLAGEPMEVIV